MREGLKEEQMPDVQHSVSDLEYLNLGNLSCPTLESNSQFMQLRGKLVNFFKMLKKFQDDP